VRFSSPLSWSVVAIALSELTRHTRASSSAEQRRLEALIASERRLHATLESLEAGLALANVDGKFVQVNEPLAAILGRSRDELMHTTLADVTEERDREAVDGALALLRSGDVNELGGGRDAGEARRHARAGQAVHRHAAQHGPRRAGSADRGNGHLSPQAGGLSSRVHGRRPAGDHHLRQPRMRQCRKSWARFAAISIGRGAVLALDSDRQAMRARHVWNASGAVLEGFPSRQPFRRSPRPAPAWSAAPGRAAWSRARKTSTKRSITRPQLPPGQLASTRRSRCQ